MTEFATETEARNLTALRDYNVLGAPSEAAFDRITRLARTVLRMPIAQISFIENGRQWLKADEGGVPRDVGRGNSFCAHAIEGDGPLIVPDALADRRFAALPQVSGKPHVRSFLAVPLRMAAGFNIGAICVMDVVARQPTSEEIAVLEDLAAVVVDELELRRAATVDRLTGALNRHAFLDAAEREIARSRRTQRELSCIALDIDYFKGVNDGYGHAAGDRALYEMVRALTSCIGEAGYVGRTGGDGFAIMLPGAGRAVAAETGERLRSRVMNAGLASPAGAIHFTISLGAATLRASDANIGELLCRADDALYAAKAAGRNRFVSAERLPLRLVVR
jgi:diguanylate cyclase (GGDEF)-like protein